MSSEQLKRRCDRISSLLGKTNSSYHERYALDPVKYVHDVLKVRHLAPAQASIMRRVAELKVTRSRARILAPSANETGKSFIAACLMSWHYDCFRPSITILTAPAKAQVDQITFRELRKLRRGDPAFAPRASFLSDDDDHLCYGYTAKNATAFHGRHEGSVLGIFDEAEGIDGEFWEAAESFLDLWICFYNPTQANSQAAVEERSGRWEVIPMSALEHPNIRLAERGIAPIIPHAVTLQKVLDRLEKWGVELRPDEPPLPGDVTVAGRSFRPGPVAEARVLGRRPTKNVNAVFETPHVLGMFTTPAVPRDDWALQVGVDVARFGDDFTTIHVRKGKCSLEHESHNGWDTKQVARRLQEIGYRLGREHNVDPLDIPFVVDSIGIGVGVIDQRNGFRFIGVNTSRLCDEEHEEDYINLRSQIAFEFEDLVRHSLVDMTRVDEQSRRDITDQLCAMSYELGPRGQRVVAPKKVLKELLSRSPDDADAVLLAYYQFPATLEVYR